MAYRLCHHCYQKSNRHTPFPQAVADLRASCASKLTLFSTIASPSKSRQHSSCPASARRRRAGASIKSWGNCPKAQAAMPRQRISSSSRPCRSQRRLLVCTERGFARDLIVRGKGNKSRRAYFPPESTVSATFGMPPQDWDYTPIYAA